MLGRFAPPFSTPEEGLGLLVARADGSISRLGPQRSSRLVSPLWTYERSRTARTLETARDTHNSNLRQLCEAVRPQVLWWAKQALSRLVALRWTRSP